MDAFRALDAVGLGDRDTRARTRCAPRWSSAPSTCPTFDELFDLYFSGLGEAIARSPRARMDALELDAGRVPALPRAARRSCCASRASSCRRWPQALLRADAGRLEQMLREAARAGAGSTSIEHGFQEGRFTHGAGGGARPRRAVGASWTRLKEQLGRRRRRRRRRAARASTSTAGCRTCTDMIKALRAQRAGAQDVTARATSSACRRWPRRASTTSPRTRSAACRRRSRKLAQRLKQRGRRSGGERAKRGKFDFKRHAAQEPAVRRRAVPHRLRSQAQATSRR